MIGQRAEQLGMISVPWQEYTTPYTPAEALTYGTIFSGLHQPYTPVPCGQQTTTNCCNQQSVQQSQMTMQTMQKKR